MKFALKYQEATKKNRKSNAKFCWYSKEPKYDSLSAFKLKSENPKWGHECHFYSQTSGGYLKNTANT